MMNTPKFDDITSALFIQPHPDDNEIGAGGMMAKLVDKGIPVYSLTVTKGDGGSDVYSPEELAEIRHHLGLFKHQLLDTTVFFASLGAFNLLLQFASRRPHLHYFRIHLRPVFLTISSL